MVADFSSVQTFSPSPPSILKACVETRLSVTIITSLIIKCICAPDPWYLETDLRDAGLVTQPRYDVMMCYDAPGPWRHGQWREVTWRVRDKWITRKEDVVHLAKIVQNSAVFRHGSSEDKIDFIMVITLLIAC